MEESIASTLLSDLTAVCLREKSLSPKKVDVVPATCGWCEREGHILRDCPAFKPYKRGCSTRSYYNERGELEKQDLQGFCAAGVLLYYFDTSGKAHVLMIEECRGKEVKSFNFLGGKRDLQSETPIATAARELLEETTSETYGSRLSPKLVEEIKARTIFDGKPVIWASGSKYALFILEVCPDDIMIGSAEFGNELAWLPLKRIQEGLAPVAPFAREMVSELKLNTTDYLKMKLAV